MQDLVKGIKALILEEELAPGDRLPTEKDLAEHFGVSRHKLREGLQGLAVLGIIEASPRRGTRVCAYDASVWAENLAFHGRVTGYELVEAYEARMALELSVVPVVIRRATDEDWLRFERQLLEMKLAIAEQKMELFTQADQDFHELLIEATHNPLLQMLQPIVRWIFIEIQRAMVPTLEDSNKALKEHRAIITAMRDGDVTKAQALLEDHLKTGLHHAGSLLNGE